MNRLIYFVVGDKKLNSGNGIYVRDLETMKARLMKFRLKNKWRLIISMHGSQSVIATRGGLLKNPDAKGAYDADELKELFGDDRFERWRKSYGPTWTTLNSCQVQRPFEKVLLDVLNKPSSKQRPHGLGQSCRPYTEVMWYYDVNDRKIDSKTRWRRMSKSDKKGFDEMLKELNRKFGYFGTPPVAESLLERYYFSEEPLGGWPVVTVSYNRKDTGISYQDRAQNTRFLKKCAKHIGSLRGRKGSVVPPAPR